MSNLWEKCKHGYYITPLHKCPWCFDGDVQKYRMVEGKGNGWLLEKDDLACLGCGGPRGGGWGAWIGPEDPTPENVRAALEKIKFCLDCHKENK